MIGDTDFFIDLIHPGRPDHARAVEKAEDLESRGIRIAMTAVTRFELASGIEQFVRPEEERERVQGLLRAYPTYALDGSAADLAGAIHGSLRRRGRTLGTADALIAAIALSNREAFLTRNRKDFVQVPGLTVETY